MKIFFDLFPVVLFFIAYKMYDIYTATAVIIGAMALQVGYLWIRHRKVENTYKFGFIAVLVLGGLTLALRNPDFIKWKPSIVNWGLGLAFLVSQYIGDRPIVQRMMESALELPARLWARLNTAWVAFFVVCGVANLAVAYTVSENAWVNFKLFGLTAMSLVFIVGQMFFLRGYLPEPAEAAVGE